MVFPKAPLASNAVLEEILEPIKAEIAELRDISPTNDKTLIRVPSIAKIEPSKIVNKIETTKNDSITTELPFTIREICGKGSGMFASRKIYPGEIILAEKPLILVSDEIFQDSERLDNFLDKAVNKMSTEDREKFLELSDCRGLDQSYIGIFYTNTMNYDNMAAVVPMMSRSNHSCRPNAEFIARIDLGLQHLMAMHVIEEGEEICINYMAASDDGMDNRETRQKYLRYYYGFHCVCAICTLQGDDLKKNEEIREEVKEFQSVGLPNLPIEDLEILLDKCHSLGCKLSYILDIIDELYSRAEDDFDDLVNMVKYGVKGCIIANTVYGDGSIESDAWEHRAHFWNNIEFSSLDT